MVFQDENILISSGACDGTIKMWDIRKNYSSFKEAPLPYHMIPYPDERATRKHGKVMFVWTIARMSLGTINNLQRDWCRRKFGWLEEIF